MEMLITLANDDNYFTALQGFVFCFVKEKRALAALVCWLTTISWKSSNFRLTNQQPRQKHDLSVEVDTNLKLDTVIITVYC